jgi:uncharacterized protein
VKPVALITGASSGIGAEFARQVAARGHDLILVARRRDRLEALASELNTEVDVIAADLADPQACDRVAERLADEPRLALLVNNAGFGTKQRFWIADLESQETMHRLHVMATVRLTHAALKNMVPRGSGAVINVASVAAFGRSQSNVSYCSTKTWMLAFTESLTLELRGAGSPVQVQALCPGFTYSEFHDVLGADRSVVPKWLWMSASEVVRASLEGLDKRKVVVVPGLVYRFFATVFPRLPLAVRLALQGRSPHTKGRV